MTLAPQPSPIAGTPFTENEAAWVSAAAAAFSAIRHAMRFNLTPEELWKISDLADALHNLNMAGRAPHIFDMYHTAPKLSWVQATTRELDQLRDPLRQRPTRPAGARRHIGRQEIVE